MRDGMYNEIAEVAYELHEKRGWKHGNDLQDWLEAERIVFTRYEKGSEKKKPKKLSNAAAKKR
jgi:hypothetical protein